MPVFDLFLLCKKRNQQDVKGRGKREEGRGKKEEGRRKKEEGRGKREEGRGKREEGRGKREEAIYQIGVNHFPYTNNWELGDLSATKLVGYYLLKQIGSAL
ncbi:MAG: hypothetical protein RR084_06410 [Bacteroidales bacterium]